MTIERILEVVKHNHPNADLTMIQLAYEFAAKAHKGQKRNSGEDYIQHPLETSYKLALLNLDMPTIIGGLIHDIPEDTQYTLEDINNEFGEEVASLVKGITKLGRIKYRGLERYAENLRKMFVAMAQDVRVILIKFADRIHNLKTLYSLPPIKQQRVARESLEIYAPIANRLGMEELKGEIEDLAFPYVYPNEYKWVIDNFKKKYEEQKRYSDKVLRYLEKELQATDTQFISVHGRAKRYYSLYQKLLRRNMDVKRIYDIVALRIIVNNIEDCYQTLGFLHKKWKPVPGRVKDYIAQPKPNGYQSLHTTVFCEDGHIAEFQIRTQKMHDEAEYGIAAHWTWKELTDGKPSRISIPTEKIKWIQELLDKQNKVSTTKRYLKSLKLDFFKNRIFVFTPKGDVIDLPENATPIDFAYHIHSYIGDHCVGCKINNQQSNLSTKLDNGDIIEINIDKNRKGPSEGWLNFVQTHVAKERIKNFFKRQRTKSTLIKFFARN